jgi:hypothetical protein
MNDKVYTILVLDENYIENFEIYEDIEHAKKRFKSLLRERGQGMLSQRKSLKKEFYREGDWQVQLIKSDILTKVKR